MVCPDAPQVRGAAEDLARRMSLALVESADQPGDAEFLLVRTAHRLELRERGVRARPIYVDFLSGSLATRRLTGQSRRQPLARAIGLRGPTMRVVDATAGLARDAFLLACLGCTVTAIERSPVLFALVEDAMRRARGQRASLERILGRIDLRLGDSRELLAKVPESGEVVDAVYLDPMYEPADRSALAKKEMRMCRRLVGGDEDAAELFNVALRVARKRVVVKRHPEAPPLAPDPSITIRARTVRYDVYLVPLPGRERAG